MPGKGQQLFSFSMSPSEGIKLYNYAELSHLQYIVINLHILFRVSKKLSHFQISLISHPYTITLFFINKET